MSIDLVVDALEGAARDVRLRFNGAVAADLDGDEEQGADYNIVLLDAEHVLPARSEGEGEAFAEEVAGSLPPGALRASFRMLWLDDELCVLQHAEWGFAVLERVRDAPVADDDGQDVESIWAGSPF